MVQDAWTRWQSTDRGVVRDPQAFLTTTATRLAINVLQSARTRRETYVGPWLPNRSIRAPIPDWAPSAAAKSSFEVRDVAILGGCDESFKQTSLLGRIRGHLSAISDVLPSARHHLPRVGLLKPEGVRDVAVCVVERLPKDVSGTFGGRQLLQQ